MSVVDLELNNTIKKYKENNNNNKNNNTEKKQRWYLFFVGKEAPHFYCVVLSICYTDYKKNALY